MANLIAKKLSKLPIGTQVEVTYGDGASHHEIAAGIITDSDFSANIEITTLRGEEIVLDFSIVRGVQVTKALPDILKELSEGTKVRFSYGTAEQREPVLSGTVTENDNEENVEIKTASGEELVLNYSLIQSLLVQSKGIAQAPAAVAQVAPAAAKPVPVAAPVAQPKAAVLLHTQEPGDYLNASDNKLKDLFDQIPLGDRKKLGSVFDSFKYGVKMNDKSKMTTAANQARQILYREDDQGYYWTTEAVMFCGGNPSLHVARLECFEYGTVFFQNGCQIVGWIPFLYCPMGDIEIIPIQSFLHITVVAGTVNDRLEATVDTQHFFQVTAHSIEFHKLKNLFQGFHLIICNPFDCPLDTLNFQQSFHRAEIVNVPLRKAFHEGSTVRDGFNQSFCFNTAQNLTDGGSADAVAVAKVLLYDSLSAPHLSPQNIYFQFFLNFLCFCPLFLIIIIKKIQFIHGSHS